MFEFDEKKVIEFIKQNQSKKVLLQLPDGLKASVQDLIKKVESQTGAEVLIWFGTNFGACDLPLSAQNLGVDLVVGFGHNTYVKDAKW